MERPARASRSPKFWSPLSCWEWELLALAGAFGGVTRMIGRGKVETRAAMAASRRMESLRLAAGRQLARVVPSAAFASGGPVFSGGMTESWLVPPPAGSGNCAGHRHLSDRPGAPPAVLETRVDVLTPSRGGFTLVEALVALALTLVVAGSLYGLLAQYPADHPGPGSAGRPPVQPAGRVARRPSEFRELTRPGGSASRTTSCATGASAMTYRAMRGIGFICGSPTARAISTSRRSTFSGHRDPQAGRDEVLILLPDTGAAGTDSWLSAPIRAVATPVPAPDSLGPASP